MKGMFRTLFALLVLLASQNCVAERAVHLHQAPVSHHHHSPHEFGSHQNTAGHGEETSTPDELACFQQVTAQAKQLEQRIKFSYFVLPTTVLAVLPDDGRYSAATAANETHELLRPRASVHGKPKFYLSTRSPNAPPPPLLAQIVVV